MACYAGIKGRAVRDFPPVDDQDFITSGLHGLLPVASLADFLMFVYFGPHGTHCNIMNDTLDMNASGRSCNSGGTEFFCF